VAAYVIAHLTVTDPDRYTGYGSGFVPILHRYGGRLLMVDDEVTVLEGAPESGRHVILEFDDRGSAEAWYRSPEYQGILPHRLAAAATHFVAIAETPTAVSDWITSQIS
jgi:uncharacterized protein (DUF1330 family)